MFQIYFHAVVGAKKKASVAIDDVNITTDQCSFSPRTAKPKDIITEGNVQFRLRVMAVVAVGAIATAAIVVVVVVVVVQSLI